MADSAASWLNKEEDSRNRELKKIVDRSSMVKFLEDQVEGNLRRRSTAGVQAEEADNTAPRRNAASTTQQDFAPLRRDDYDGEPAVSAERPPTGESREVGHHEGGAREVQETLLRDLLEAGPSDAERDAAHGLRQHELLCRKLGEELLSYSFAFSLFNTLSASYPVCAEEIVYSHSDWVRTIISHNKSLEDQLEHYRRSTCALKEYVSYMEANAVWGELDSTVESWNESGTGPTSFEASQKFEGNTHWEQYQSWWAAWGYDNAEGTPQNYIQCSPGNPSPSPSTISRSSRKSGEAEGNPGLAVPTRYYKLSEKEKEALQWKSAIRGSTFNSEKKKRVTWDIEDESRVLYHWNIRLMIGGSMVPRNIKGEGKVFGKQSTTL